MKGLEAFLYQPHLIFIFFLFSGILDKQWDIKNHKRLLHEKLKRISKSIFNPKLSRLENKQQTGRFPRENLVFPKQATSLLLLSFGAQKASYKRFSYMNSRIGNGYFYLSFNCTTGNTRLTSQCYWNKSCHYIFPNPTLTFMSPKLPFYSTHTA